MSGDTHSYTQIRILPIVVNRQFGSNKLIVGFRRLAETEGVGYQTLINRALCESLADGPVSERTLRRVIREELGAWNP